MNLEQNKRNAMAFYETAFLGNPREAVQRHVGEEYIQHNPAVADGPEGFIDYFERMHKDYPGKSVAFLRCIAEGDLVALHTRQVWPGDHEYVTIDIFRFDDQGKICEHWDAIQQIPQSSANSNRMY